MKAIIGYSVLGFLGASTLLFAICYGWDELQWRRIERRARRNPCVGFAHERRHLAE